MTVYLIFGMAGWRENEPNFIKGFSTKEKAELFLEKQRNIPSSYSSYIITPHELD
jgi:hypothetical protein